MGSGREHGAGVGGGTLRRRRGASPRRPAPALSSRGGRPHLRPPPSPSQSGDTALDMAKERKHTEVIGILENAPADAAQATKPTAKMASATKPAAAKRPAVKKTVAKKTIAKNPAAAKKKPVAKGGCGPLARHGRRKPTEPIVPPRRRPLTTRTTTSSTSRPENS